VVALITFSLEISRSRRPSHPTSYLTVGFLLGRTFRGWRDYDQCIQNGYLFFNDGIQTVINLASYLRRNFIAKGIPTDRSFLLGIFLLAVCGNFRRAYF
jgi:hypothetical protein